HDIDWIVVVMHQVAMSSAHFNGADLGIRQEWLPLFDAYGVDLVVAGHEHHFERTFAVRGTLPGDAGLRTPAPQGDDPLMIDTTKGTVHMIIGGGGHPGFTPATAFDMPHDGVLIVGVEPGNPQVQRAPIVVTEPAPWSAYRDLTTPYGFATSMSCPIPERPRRPSPSPVTGRPRARPRPRRSTPSPWCARWVRGPCRRPRLWVFSDRPDSEQHE
ncbi:MAG: hypothetical protein QOG44_2831, partial [Acidimicrobiaceae bacterium]|nr:hypothetical protein [Acidimicrobiaceae bacterium]